MEAGLQRNATGWWCIGIACVLFAMGCGSSTQAPPQTELEAVEYSHRIARVASADAAPNCDRSASLPCGAGECRVAIRREPSATAFDVYATCVAPESTLPLDMPCEPWGGRERRLERNGLSAEVYVDPCAADLVCTNSPADLADYRCRPSCDLASEQLCQAGDYCYAGATALQGACLPTDGCDPTLREGCADGVACYLRPSDRLDGLVTTCLPIFNATPLPDLSPCESTLDCRPGSWCWGPSSVRPGEWPAEAQRCRKTCDASYEDALVCDEGMICRELVKAKQVLDFSLVPVPLGQCEPR
jgi:hypothetical protein